MSNKTCLITGSSRGIGAGCALLFARNGYNVVVNYTSREPQDLVAQLEEMGASYLVVKGDVSKPEDAQHLVDAAVETFGSLDVLVNNAGITKDNLMLRMKAEDFSQVLDVNLLGTFNMTKAASAVMMKKRQGSIINISSVVGLRGNAGQVNYAASKAGIIGLTKSVAKELAKRSITCNAIAPGFIETEMTDVLSDKVKERILQDIPMGTLGKTQDIAQLALFLASEGSRYITGQIIAVDGGMSM
ncbi:3-oxoacyl-[acyl-carrier-protein] reductase [Proteiniclasticum sp. BAD-10]|uniref:3-oxoacyl-[acyl-carrier-protein] reductase n=1 Tax=Proteiniclasticum sediminis TaxID=2804028 RepID=A0A941HPF7_9CLOT|nr:3-oxoacyl-[acyl-carrier-protein] reductase [Proteiniclasticum sediminis]MBR0575294.1 3-oxoacyl-[acyl-carrier-protein] reductase [Proteiniclasticum sediminis]